MRLIVLLLLASLTGCDYFTNKMTNGIGVFNGIPFLHKINSNKEMDEVTKRGMIDGCFTGYHARGASFYRTMLYFRQDPNMANNDDYTFAWGRAYTACFSEAVMWGLAMNFGDKFLTTSSPGIWWSPIEQNVEMPLGGDAESKPAVWYFDESPSRGLPGNANYGTNRNFFGLFGTCYAC
jgi:hypothetical protein